MFKVGDKICWFGAAETPASLQEGTITKMWKELSWVNNQHKAEDCIITSHLWPISVKAELVTILTERARLKKEYDDNLKLVELRNRVTKGQT